VLMTGMLDITGNGLAAVNSLYWCVDMIVLMYFPAVLISAAASDHPPPSVARRLSQSKVEEAKVEEAKAEQARPVKEGLPKKLKHTDEQEQAQAQEQEQEAEDPPMRVVKTQQAAKVAAVPKLSAVPPRNPSAPISEGAATLSQRSSQSTPLASPKSTPRPVASTPRTEMIATPRQPMEEGNVLGLVLSRWMKQNLVSAFGRWDQAVSEKMRMKFVAGKVVRRWIHQALWGFYDKWNEFAKRSKMLKKTAKQVKRRWDILASKQYFVPWVQGMQEQWHLRCMEKKMKKWRGDHIKWAAFITWRDAEGDGEDGVLDNVFFKLATDIDKSLTSFRGFFDSSPSKKQRSVAYDGAGQEPRFVEEDDKFVML